MAKRKKLSDLITRETQRSTELIESKSSGVTDLDSREVTELQSSDSSSLPTTKVTDLQSSELPKYLTLVRKEARLAEDQLDRLTALTRKLNRQKTGGERITENTLIRVAVDLLLRCAEDLEGATEEQLRESIEGRCPR